MGSVWLQCHHKSPPPRREPRSVPESLTRRTAPRSVVSADGDDFYHLHPEVAPESGAASEAASTTFSVRLRFLQPGAHLVVVSWVVQASRLRLCTICGSANIIFGSGISSVARRIPSMARLIISATARLTPSMARLISSWVVQATRLGLCTAERIKHAHGLGSNADVYPVLQAP